MFKVVVGIVGLAVVVWTVGCGTHSGIGNVGMGGNAGGGFGGFNVDGGASGTAGEGGGGMSGTAGEGGGGPGGAAGMGVGGIPDFCAGASGVGGATTVAPRTLAFKAPVDYPTGSGAMAVAAGDLNGDGKIDLALLDQTAGVRVMINNGDGTFGGPADHALGSFPVAIALGDLNGDSTTDIAVATTAGISVLRNPGNGDFAPPVTYVVGNGSIALALGDLNHDGQLDIAVADQGGGAGDVGILLNAGGATFSAQNYGTINGARSIALGDLDGDCIPDVVVADQGGLTWMAGDGVGGLRAQNHLANGTVGASVAIADLNGDGKMDLVEGDQGASGAGIAYVLLNRGSGLFTAPTRYSLLDAPGNAVAGAQTSSVGIAVANLNGDHAPDLLGFAPCCNLGVFSNTSNGSFATPVAFSMPPYPVSMAHGDFNGDGLEDVAIVSANGGGFSFVSNLRVLINGSHY